MSAPLTPAERALARVSAWAPIMVRNIVKRAKFGETGLYGCVIDRFAWAGEALRQGGGGLATMLNLGRVEEVPARFRRLPPLPRGEAAVASFSKALSGERIPSTEHEAAKTIDPTLFALTKELRATGWTRLLAASHVFVADVYGMPIVLTTALTTSEIGKRHLAARASERP